MVKSKKRPPDAEDDRMADVIKQNSFGGDP